MNAETRQVILGWRPGEDRWVLITGCSTGIGRALVDSMRRRGWGVVATARNPESLADMKVRLQVADAEGGGVEQREPGLAEGQTGREDVGRERRDSAWSGEPTPTDCCDLERPIEQPSSRVMPQRGMVSDLSGEDLRILALDVRDEASIAACVASCSDIRLVALVNNAGYGQMGPLELLRGSELREQFETNVLGLQAVTNAFLPLIRKNAKNGEGRVVHLASVLGRLSIPMAGAYNASKHAVVALAETLRLEIGREIPVILVEPGAIRTEFRKTLVNAWGDLPERVRGTRYADTVQRYREQRERFAQAHGMSAEACAEKIAKAMTKLNPPRRLVVGPDAYWSLKAKALLPMALWEWALRKLYGLG